MCSGFGIRGAEHSSARCDMHISRQNARTQPHQKFESNQLGNHLNANLPGGSTHYLKIPPAHKLAWPPPRLRVLPDTNSARASVPPLPFWVSEIWQTIMRSSFITNARQLYKLLDGATLQAIITTFRMHPANPQLE